MRWHILVIITSLVGMLQLTAGADLVIYSPAVRSELLFVLAYQTAMHCRKSHIIPVFWIAGLLQDLFLGAHLGSNVILFCGAGFAVSALRQRIVPENLPTRVAAVWALLMVMLLLRPILETRTIAPLFADGALTGIIASAVISAVIVPLAGLILSGDLLRPWRDEEIDYGLSG
jgi:cell shape-determining protein MreD